MSQSSSPQIKTEAKIAETESVEKSSVTSQIAEIKDSYERKFNDIIE